MLVEDDSDDTSLTLNGVFEEDFSFVILFDDAFCQREAKSPSTLFCGITRVEEVFLCVAGHSFASVAEVDVDGVGILRGYYAEGSCTIHGVDGVFADILHHPFKKVGVEWRHHRLFRNVGYEVDFF